VIGSTTLVHRSTPQVDAAAMTGFDAVLRLASGETVTQPVNASGKG
jgi:hypothetical protein